MHVMRCGLSNPDAYPSPTLLPLLWMQPVANQLEVACWTCGSVHLDERVKRYHTPQVQHYTYAVMPAHAYRAVATFTNP